MAGLGIVVLVFAAGMASGRRQALLVLLGSSLGAVLYQHAFGFTAAWRTFIRDRDAAGLQAQVLMLAIACVLFFPALAAGAFAGRPLIGFVFPVGPGVVIGAFLFGIGMQLGGGCGSGTLYTMGGGNARMVVTLTAFVLGSLLATAHLPFWLSLPAIAPVSFVALWGPWWALAAHLAVFAGLALLLHRYAAGSSFLPPRRLVGGAVGLAVLNFATLVVAGRPWGITSAFALWGAKLAIAVGLPVTGWPYWSEPGMAAALEASVLADLTSVMNFGLVLGALAAAAAAGRFRPNLRVPPRSFLAATVGGLLMGYGARLAFGCNVGAFFSGVASGSLHGWVWLAAAFAGSVVGVRLRPWFRLD
ncbi:MAG: YeeE/YedE family protein [Geminicoccaceae bacterium]